MQASLHKAAKIGNLEQVKHIIAQGADLTQKNIYGQTALALARQFKHKEVAKFLKAHGAK